MIYPYCFDRDAIMSDGVVMKNFNLKVSNFLKWKYSEEQLSVYALSRSMYSTYDFNDECKFPSNNFTRQELIEINAEKLTPEGKYQQSLEYWIEKYGNDIFSDIDKFFYN